MTDPNKTPPIPATAPVATLDELLGTDRPRPWWRRPSTWGAAVAVLALAGAAVWWQGRQAVKDGPVYVTEPARVGKLSLTVAADGTLQPTRTVNIGSELSGTVARVLVDVNDRVKKGQVLVELDTAKLQDQVKRSRANLASAQAALAEREATVKEAQATLARYEEVARLSGGQVPSATELDTARAAVARARASLDSARASVDEARAAASTDATNLTKASIRSPIDGVILTRTVDPGNAVAASLQAVTLFQVAEDLRSLKLNVSVDEADIGSVKEGQTATFTVSAYPARRYPATISRVAFGSTKTDGVVTYTTELTVDNADLSLRPGMTASATVVATERDKVLLVPNTALRFVPAAAPAAASAGGGNGNLLSKLMPRAPRTGARPAPGDAGAGAQRQVWVLRDGQAVPLRVSTGISDGRQTEITGGELQAGMAVITDQRSAAAKP
ncbi:efflux RND transporter periplasmic adaptor subunit [Hydrogenophaga sp.]|uniref:efflux RND transporter periplasmic adaptor subunit n=1 Tax=Hydrogenophaga sp. TaxID=1904254 RepID=UPI0035B2723A